MKNVNSNYDSFVLVSVSRDCIHHKMKPFQLFEYTFKVQNHREKASSSSLLGLHLDFRISTFILYLFVMFVKSQQLSYIPATHQNHKYDEALLTFSIHIKSTETIDKKLLHTYSKLQKSNLAEWSFILLFDELTCNSSIFLNKNTGKQRLISIVFLFILFLGLVRLFFHTFCS